MPDSIPLISLRRGLRGTGNCRACIQSLSEPLESEVCHGGRPRALFIPLAQSFASTSASLAQCVASTRSIGIRARRIAYCSRRRRVSSVWCMPDMVGNSGPRGPFCCGGGCYITVRKGV